MRLLDDVARSSHAVRTVLIGTLLLGVGQQMFVVARNPLLAELGFRIDAIPWVQGAGAAAGVVSGVLALVLTPRVRIAALFATCALLQAIGFGIQTFARGGAVFIVGAAIAGLAIQLNTAAAPPALKVLTTDQSRVSIFTAHALALMACAGFLAALLTAAIGLPFGRGVASHRVTLAAAAAASFVAVFVFLRIDRSSLALKSRADHALARRRRVWVCVSFQAALGFAGGLTLPFLQLYFKVTFGVALTGIAFLYGSAMVLGAATQALSPFLAHRFGLWRSIVLLQLLVLPFFVELALATSVRFAAFAFVARHTLASTASPLLSAFFQQVSFDRDGEMVAGMGMVTSSVTWAAGTLLAGPLLASAGGRFERVIALSAATYAVIAAAAWWVFPRLWRDRPSDRRDGG